MAGSGQMYSVKIQLTALKFLPATNQKGAFILANKKLLTVAGLLATVGVAGVLGLSSVSAEETTDSKSDPMSSLVDKIASKFNLKEEEVQAVFDEHKDEMQAKHKSKIEERLNTAVSEGKLTQDQKNKILAKLEELKNDRPDKSELENKSPEEIKALMEQKRSELEAWAEQNDIPKEHLRFVGHGGPGFHIRMEKGQESSMDVKSEL